MIIFTKIRTGTIYPTKATELSACWDLYNGTGIDLELKSGCRLIIPTGLTIDMPPLFEMQIKSRSGLAAKHGICVLNAPGIVDADFLPKGDDDPFDFEIKVILYNSSDVDYIIKHDERIAQASFVEISRESLDIWHTIENSKQLMRCEIKSQSRLGGLGSTGK